MVYWVGVLFGWKFSGGKNVSNDILVWQDYRQAGTLYRDYCIIIVVIIINYHSYLNCWSENIGGFGVYMCVCVGGCRGGVVVTKCS